MFVNTIRSLIELNNLKCICGIIIFFFFSISRMWTKFKSIHISWHVSKWVNMRKWSICCLQCFSIIICWPTNCVNEPPFRRSFCDWGDCVHDSKIHTKEKQMTQTIFFVSFQTRKRIWLIVFFFFGLDNLVHWSQLFFKTGSIQRCMCMYVLGGHSIEWMIILFDQFDCCWTVYWILQFRKSDL